MSEIRLIGLNSPKTGGKDTVAKMIQEETIEISAKNNTEYVNIGTAESKWQTKRFSQKLKEAVALLYGTTVELLEDQGYKENMYYHFLTGEKMHWNKIHEKYLSGTITTCLNASALSDGIRYTNSDIWTNMRVILQHFGTELGRDMLGTNFWVNSTFANYTLKSNWILVDTRFPNELEAIKSRGGLLIRIERPGLDLSDQHPSETALNDYKDWDEVILNYGTLDDLREKVKEIVKKYNL